MDSAGLVTHCLTRPAPDPHTASCGPHTVPPELRLDQGQDWDETLSASQREAEDLCACLPWLTTAQADDLAHHYIRQRNHLTRLMFQETLRRAAQLRQEYESRYAVLRRDLLRRHASVASAVLACAVGLSAAAAVFAR